MLMVAIRYGRYFAKQVESVSEAEDYSADGDYCVITGIYDGHTLLSGQGIDYTINVLNDLIEKGSMPKPQWINVQYGRYMEKDLYARYRPEVGIRKEQLAQLLKIKAEYNL